jgi:Na+-translocating ferredoxin:NAD+ oxidoreductase RnfG subunit
MLSLIIGQDSGITAAELQIFAPLLGMLATMVGVLVFLVKSYRQTEIAATEAKQTNNSVNNVLPGMPTLYQQVLQIKETMNKFTDAQDDFTQKGWRSLPEDINTAIGLTETIRELQHKDIAIQESLDSLGERLDVMVEELREHINWAQTHG